jgi:DNA primase
MGKTYIDTVKYLVYANLEIGGLVEKPDVVGAVFGQTEGLLGDELDLRELQKNGRIGRIEVDMQSRGGKTIGKIKLPSSLDMVETCILAAALETVDRVGPCDAKIIIEKVEDTRNLKRKQLVDRAKGLLKSLLINEIPESREISEMVRSEVKIAEISEYGPDKLPAGPGIDKLDAIVVVEGRADVVNLLKNDIANAVAVGGANVPPSLANLCREKEVTLFLDGDRGGDIIMTQLAEVADIDFVARAPVGKEVEELTRKELIKCMRSKIPFEQAMDELKNKGAVGGERRRYDDRREPRRFERRDDRFDRRDDRYSRPMSPPEPQQMFPKPPERSIEGIAAPLAPRTRLEQRQQAQAQAAAVQTSAPETEPVKTATAAPAVSAVPPELLSALGELENTLSARFYDSGFKIVKEIPVRDMIRSLEEVSELGAVVFDGIITQRLADLVEAKKAKVLVGIKMGNVSRKPAGLLVYTKS